MPFRGFTRGYFFTHPRVGVVLGWVVLVGLGALSVKRLLHARTTVHAHWSATVIVGIAASVALIAAALGVRWLVRRRHAQSQLLIYGLTIALTVIYLGDFWLTAVTLQPRIGSPETITTAFQLGALAFLLPMYVYLLFLLAVVFRKVTSARKAGGGELITRDQG